MRFFSYQNKRRIKTILLGCVILAAVYLLFCLCRFIYLQRYLVYTGTEVVLDYEQDIDSQVAQEIPVWQEAPVEIITEDPVAQVSAQADQPLQPISGTYITTQMLLDMEQVSHALAALQEYPETIMLELKSIYGNFYYSSSTPGAVTSSADIAAVDELIRQLSSRNGLYLIARISSLSDTNFALANQSCGLPLRSGALWMSDRGCYWLDPMDETVQDYLVAIASELSRMGFHEVVFDDFRIPDSKNIIYSGDVPREEAAAAAAEAIREKLAGVPIRVSFNSADPNVAAHTDRVYLVTEDGSSVSGLVSGVSENIEDPAAQIVFLTPSRDTRFDDYSILRPLIEARQE